MSDLPGYGAATYCGNCYSLFHTSGQCPDLEEEMIEEIKNAVREQMTSMAEDVEPLSYAEAYDFNDDEVAKAMELQQKARITITWDDDNAA